MPDWYEDDTFWRELYPFIFSNARFAAADEEIGKLLALIGVDGGSVLDLCCGPGRHAIPLARRGLEVTGVDHTASLLDKARAGAREAGVEIEWVEDDMRRFVRPESFDLAVSLFTSFGYFEDKAEDVQVLGNLFRSLRPGGVCVIDVLGKEVLAVRYRPVIVDELEDGGLLVQRPKIVEGWSRVESDWTLVQGERARSFSFRHTIYSGQELRDRLEQAGFASVELYGNLDGGEYGVDAVRLLAVARKGGE